MSCVDRNEPRKYPRSRGGSTVHEAGCVLKDRDFFALDDAALQLATCSCSWRYGFLENVVGDAVQFAASEVAPAGADGDVSRHLRTSLPCDIELVRNSVAKLAHDLKFRDACARSSVLLASMMTDRMLTEKLRAQLAQLSHTLPGLMPMRTYSDQASQLHGAKYHTCVNDCHCVHNNLPFWPPQAEASWRECDVCTHCEEPRFNKDAAGRLTPRRYYYSWSMLPMVHTRMASGEHGAAVNFLKLNGHLQMMEGMCDKCSGQDQDQGECTCEKLALGHMFRHKAIQYLRHCYQLFDDERFSDYVHELAADGAPVYKKENGKTVTLIFSRNLVVIPTGKRPLSHCYSMVPDLSRQPDGISDFDHTHEPAHLYPYFGGLLMDERLVENGIQVYEPRNNGAPTKLRMVKFLCGDHPALVHMLGGANSAAANGCGDCFAVGEVLPSKNLLTIHEARQLKADSCAARKPANAGPIEAFLAQAMKAQQVRDGAQVELSRLLL